jgi:hypothetical protein
MSKISVNEEYNGNDIRKTIDYFCHFAKTPVDYYNIKENDVEFSSKDIFDKISWIKDKNDDFNIEFGENKQVFDLNNIFHIDLSYNFDLLKNLLSTIIKNQKLKDEKITELENQILDLRIAFNEETKKQDKKKSRKSLLPPIQENEKKQEAINADNLSVILKPPKTEPVLEVSDDNDPTVNKIIVSIKKNIYI